MYVYIKVFSPNINLQIAGRGIVLLWFECKLAASERPRRTGKFLSLHVDNLLSMANHWRVCSSNCDHQLESRRVRLQDTKYPPACSRSSSQVGSWMLAEKVDLGSLIGIKNFITWLPLVQIHVSTRYTLLWASTPTASFAWRLWLGAEVGGLEGVIHLILV